MNDLNNSNNNLNNQEKINPYGNCPICYISWDNGDVYEVIKKLNPKLSEELILERCYSYGWNEKNKLRFTKLKKIDSLSNIYICYNCITYFNKDKLNFNTDPQ